MPLGTALLLPLGMLLEMPLLMPLAPLLAPLVARQVAHLAAQLVTLLVALLGMARLEVEMVDSCLVDLVALVAQVGL